MMNNAYNMWTKVEEIANQDVEKNFYKNVFTSPILDIFFQANFDKELQIFIHFNESKIENLTLELNGIQVKTEIKQEIDKNNEVIIIKNKSVDNNNLFKAFSATLFDNIEDSSSSQITYDMILKTIDDYKEYFNGKKRKKLGLVEQQGLFGELTFILENLDIYGNNIVYFWEGVNKNKHDFVFENRSIEVKTTKNQTRLDILISNENQLDNSAVDELILMVYRLEKLEVGSTILDLCKKILEKLDYRSSNIFKSKLFQCGIDFEDQDYYKFKVIDKHMFIVDDEFPKIEKSSLNSKIFEVKYRLNLDGIGEI